MMKDNLLIFIILILTLDLYSQSKEINENKIVKIIKLEKCSDCLYDITYENSIFKLYFIKSKFSNFINSRNYDQGNNVKFLKDFIDSTNGHICFYDPYWAMDTFSLRYGKVTDGFDDCDTLNSPRAVIDRNKELKMSEIFEGVIREYLSLGECKIFNKKENKFVLTDTLYLVWNKSHHEDEYTLSKTESEVYQLPNGTKIIDKYMKVAHGDKFKMIDKNKK
jgi:hypothetical protein